MKVVFFSNFLNHHQLPFCLEMIQRDNIEFTFVATEPVPEERIKFGYENMNKKYKFVLTTYDSKQNYEKALQLGLEADLVIIGSASDEFIKKRIDLDKITFRYNERILRKGRWRVINPRLFLYVYRNHVKYKNKNLFMLCASAYTAGDYKIFGAYKNKCYRWGYFPETKKYDIKNLIEKKEKNDRIKIVWVARFLPLKHPELLISLGKYLKKKKYEFVIEMIGTGIMEEKIKRMIIKNNLEYYIKLIGAVPSKDVRKYMEEANIFLFTSDKREGWGAVLNESMNSGCAVLANKEIGSVPYLIQEYKNGLIYSNKKQFFKKVELLINDKKLRKKLSEEAYYTIINKWNAKNAIDNLIMLYENIQNNDNIIKTGPCSKIGDAI